jgi:hypothetical protein
VSPILVRPVREQLEHDRIIRILQNKFRRRFDVGINPGGEQNVPIGSGPAAMYPDVVLTSPDRGRRVQAVIEVETAESVNNLEALAQWTHFARLRSPFHLYVPAGSVDVAKRLCSDNQIEVAEIQSYHLVGDEMRFVPVYKAPSDGRSAPVRKEKSATKKEKKGVKSAPKPKAAKKRPAAASRKPARAARRR